MAESLAKIMLERMSTICIKSNTRTSEKTVEETSKNASNTAIEKGLATVEETVEEMIMNLIIDNPRVTANEMVKVTGLSRRGVEYQLGKLKHSGKIMRIGSTCSKLTLQTDSCSKLTLQTDSPWSNNR